MPKPVFVPLAAGLQTELADQLVQPGATLVLENCATLQTGQTETRFGSDVLSTSGQATLPAGGTLPAAWQLATLDGMLVRFNRAPVPIHTWARPAAAWVQPVNDGGLESLRHGPIKLDTMPIFSGTAFVSDPTVAVGTNAIVCVYQLFIGGPATSGPATVILDRTSRRPMFTRRATNGTNGRVIVLGNRAIVAFNQGGALQIDAYDLTTYTLTQQVTLGAILAGSPIDMRILGPVAGANNIHILYRDNAGVLKCGVVDATNLATNSTFGPRTTAAANVSPDLAFGWMQDFGLSGKFSIMIADSTNGLRTLWNLPAPGGGFSNATATHVLDAAATAIPTGLTAGIRNVIGTTVTNSATGVYRVLYEVATSTDVDRLQAAAQIKIAVWNGAATLGVQYRSVGIRSKFWQHSTNFYFLSAFNAQDQRSYFVLAMSNDTTLTATTFSAPLAVALPRDAAGFTESASCPSDVVTDVDGQIFIGATEQTRVESVVAAGVATGAEQQLLGVDLMRVRHPTSAETEIGKPVEFIRSLFVPGGLIGQFDGAAFDSACFPYFPPTTFAGAAAIAGGALTGPANYFYRFVYAKMDRNGRTWRSAPSVIIATATTGVNKQFSVTVDTLRLVDRATASGIKGNQIEVYRSQANAPDAFFLVAVLDNDPTVDSVSFTDDVPDVNLGEELYTDGNGLENQLLPSVSCAVEFQARLVVAQAGTGTIWWSLDADLDHGLIFNEAFTLDVGDSADPITGLAVYGEQLFVFKANKLYVVNGDGGNALGQGITYNFRLIDPDSGCSNPQSIVVDDGVWFRSSASRAGIHRTVGGQAEYVGQGVRAYDALTITAAVSIPDLTQVRFYTLEGTTLIYDSTSKLWKTNTGQPCLAATAGYSGVKGGVYASASDGSIMSEATTASANPYQEGAGTYNARLRSPWYQTGIGAWQRIKRLQGVGNVGTGRQHTARINLYKDMNGTTPFQTHDFLFPDTRTRWDWELRPAQEKCSSMMIEVLILPFTGPVYTAGPQILGVNLIPVAKEGAAKLPAANRL